MALTESKVQTHISNLIETLEELRLNFGVTASVNFLLNWSDAGKQTDYPGDFEFGGQSKIALDGLRAQVAAVIDQATAVLTPGFREYGKLNDAAASKEPFAEPDLPTIFERLREHFDANSLGVKSRAFTFATPSAGGGNSGDGIINRLNVDRRDDSLENQFQENKEAECIQDVGNGANKHEEVFELRGETRERDRIKVVGSGLVILVKALSAQDSLSYLQNPSFETLNGTEGSPNSIPGWTVDSGSLGTDFKLTSTAADVYRGFQSDGGTPRSILITNNGTGHKISQSLTARSSFDPDVPIYAQLAWKRGTASAGTLTMRLGSAVSSVVIGVQTGWQILRIPISHIDENAWFDQFNEQSLNFEIELSSALNGTLHIDDVVIGPMTNFGGGWYAVVGGATPFLRKDRFDWEDTATDAAIIQRWLWLAFNEYLPTDAVPTWSDP